MALFEQDLKLSILMIHQIFNTVCDEKQQFTLLNFPKLLQYLHAKWIQGKDTFEADINYKMDFKLGLMLNYWKQKQTPLKLNNQVENSKGFFILFLDLILIFYDIFIGF